MHVDHATPPPPAPPPAGELTAGRYLTFRREAFGLPILAAVDAAGVVGLDRYPFLRALQRAEADETPMSDAQLVRLRRAFPFDPFIYQCLRDDVPAGRICRGCGCSWNDACLIAGQPCGWVPSS